MIYIQRYLTIAFYIFFCLIVSSCDEDAVEDPVNHDSEEVSYEKNEPDDNDTHQEMAELPTIIQPQPLVTPPPPPVIQPEPERVDNTPKPDPAIIQPPPPVIQPEPERVDNTPKPDPAIIQPPPPVIQPEPEKIDNTAIPCSRFKNCTELRKVHPDGVKTARLSCAKDRNKLDRDKDGWACER